MKKNKINLKSALHSLTSTVVIASTTAVVCDETAKEVPLAEDNNDENEKKPKKKKIELKKTDLGEIKKAQNSQPINHIIKNIILKQNPELKWEIFQVVNIKKTTAIIIFNNDPSNQINITFVIIENNNKTDNETITNIETNLDEIRVFDEFVPTEIMLKSAILKKNPEFNSENYQIINISATSATIEDKKSKQMFTFNFSISRDIENTIIQDDKPKKSKSKLQARMTEYNLGIINSFGKETPNEYMIRMTFFNKNPNFDLIPEHLLIKNITATSATIIGNIPKYQGVVEIEFITEKRINLENITSLTLPEPISIMKNEKYFALNEKIIKAYEFNNKLLVSGYHIQYFDAINNEITNQNQRAGKFYVIISANTEDQIWKNKTQKIKLNLNFKLFSEINGQVNKIITDNNDNIYAASSDGNIYQCLATESKFTIIPGTIDGRNRGKNGHQIYSLTVDSKGNIYAGSVWGDIYKRKAGEKQFKIIRYGSGGGGITALTIDENTNDILFAQLKYIYKIPNNDVVNAPINQQSGPLVGGFTRVVGLKTDTKGNIYAAVTWPIWEFGVFSNTYLGHQSEVWKITFSKHFNMDTKQIYNINYHSIGSLDSDTKLKDFIIDENDNIYVSTENGCVYYYDKQNSKFKLLTIVDGQAITMAHAQNNNIYIATKEPIFSSVNGYIYKYFVNEQKTIEINWPHETITSIVVDKADNLYITTDNGKIYLA